MRLNPEAELKELQRELERMGNPWMAGRSPVFDLPPLEKLRRLGCISGPDEPSPAERERLAAVNQVSGKLEPVAAYPSQKDWAVACFGKPVVTRLRRVIRVAAARVSPLPWPGLFSSGHRSLSMSG